MTTNDPESGAEFPFGEFQDGAQWTDPDDDAPSCDDDRDDEPPEPNDGCPRCYGSGEIVTQEPYGEESWTCPACLGSGR